MVYTQGTGDPDVLADHSATDDSLHLLLKGESAHVGSPPSVGKVKAGASMKQVCVVIPGWDTESGQEHSAMSVCKLPVQPRPSPDSAFDPGDVTPEAVGQRGDEDAFSPSEIEEFRQLIGGKGGHFGGLTCKGFVVESAPPVRLPASICIPAPPPSRGRQVADRTPHIFPALKERRLTQGSTPRPRVEGKGLVTGVLSADRATRTKIADVVSTAGLDLHQNTVTTPASASSTSRRTGMNPRDTSSFSSARKLKMPKREKKEGELMMKPIAGRPGVISLHGNVAKELQHTFQRFPSPPSPRTTDSQEDLPQFFHQHLHVHHAQCGQDGELRHRYGDTSHILGTFPDVVTSGRTVPINTTSAELAPETNRQDRPQKSSTRRATVRHATIGEDLAISPDRQTRSGHVRRRRERQEEGGDPPADTSTQHTAHPSPHGGKVRHPGPVSVQGPQPHWDTPRRPGSPDGLKKPDDVSRAKTAPPGARRSRPLPAQQTSAAADPHDHSDHDTPQAEHQPTALHPWAEEDLTPRLAVVQLEMPATSAGRAGGPQPSATTPRGRVNSALPGNTLHGSACSRFALLTGMNSQLYRAGNDLNSMREDAQKANSETPTGVELVKHPQSSKESGMKVYRWKRPSGPEQKDKWDRWRIRLSFSAKRQRIWKKMSRI